MFWFIIFFAQSGVLFLQTYILNHFLNFHPLKSKIEFSKVSSLLKNWLDFILLFKKKEVWN